jgi:hypothetical protein
MESMRDLAKGLGLIVVGIAAVVGGLFALIVANDSLVAPVAQGRQALAVILIGPVVTLALAWLVAKRGLEPGTVKTVVVALAIVTGGFTVLLYSGWDSAKDRVSDYCSYGAVSEAQLAGCRSNVVEADIVKRNSPAAHFAYGSADSECGASSGPFCQAVLDRRALLAQQPDP